MRKIVIVNSEEDLNPRRKLEARALAEAGFEVQVLAWDRSGNKPREDITNGIPIRRISLAAPLASLRVAFYLPFIYARLLRELAREEFDILHCTHALLLPVSLISAKRRGARIVYDACEFYSLHFVRRLAFPVRSIIRAVIEDIENRFVRLVDGVLTVNSADDFLLKRYQRFNNNVEIIYNVPDIRNLSNYNYAKALAKQFNSHKIVIYMGRVLKRRGALQAVRALSLVKCKIPNVKLLFIGNSLDDSEEEIVRYLTQHKLIDSVGFVGRLSYEKMLGYLDIAHIGLALHQPIPEFRLLSKGNGRKFFDYMRATLPIVGPEFGEVGQVVREEKCGILVDTTDPRQIADAVIYLLEHPEEARTMGERGRKAVEEKYNWEIEKEKLLKVYRELEREIDGQKPGS